MRCTSFHDVAEMLRIKGDLLVIEEDISDTEILAEIHRRVFQSSRCPAILFPKVTAFPGIPMISNVFGRYDRVEFIFRRNLNSLIRFFELAANPKLFGAKPFSSSRHLAKVLLGTIPLPIGPCPALEESIPKSSLPGVKSWPMDGGRFITLPQVCSWGGNKPSVFSANLGMYRIQVDGNSYSSDECGVHYQIHRGIGVHHQKALQSGRDFPLSIFVGGPPENTLASIMPLPEGISELMFAGMLSGRSFRYKKMGSHIVCRDSDFTLIGNVSQALKPEGPFGDHLGYYSLQHQYPVLKISKIFKRKNAVWPLTVVGRPPQEDSAIGKFIHTLTAPMVSKVLQGVSDLHAVDAAGVHPLLLAKARESYVPFEKEKVPRELLTIAHQILGFGQCSLAKFLILIDSSDTEDLPLSNIKGVFQYLLERIDINRDLKIFSKTTIDTLDYSGTAINEGSKAVIVACGQKKRDLAGKLPGNACHLTESIRAKMIVPGIFAIQCPQFTSYESTGEQVSRIAEIFSGVDLSGIPLIILSEDSAALAHNFDQFLWQTFTKSNPSHDIYGIDSFQQHNHFHPGRAIVIDARKKPHHAPELEVSPEVADEADKILRRYRI